MLDPNKLYEQYNKLVFKIVSKRINNQDDIQDLVQETFLKAFQKIENFNPDYSPTTWLSAIANNTVTNFQRHNTYVTAAFDSEPYEEDFAVDPQKADHLRVEDLEQLETKLYEIKNLLTKLGTQYLDVYVKRELEGYTYKEIAELTGRSECCLRKRNKKAKDYLKVMLNKD